ncbi:hypothetical protein EDM53_05775 [Rickettsiales endosymbiont of Peranema trichophorum]|uniref:hypothetical protein n=1 Tax=Rickettsiales endosymbiont of Peranema trichophorum TaxID=2486577 RepID=UPI0010232E61|nr:hypothetical protein [Rickettsiales endosymbiont of Peranema trichophorum]RZI45169.1 hypothetical protein EDM53_05775 [Rickettsiales endosymbiont of Peranema trichophorum]
MNQLIKSAGGNLSVLEQSIQDMPKEVIKNPLFVRVAIQGSDANLVTNFTSTQALENMKLFILNMIASSGKYYERAYPTQEFDQFISLFNVLFSKVKTYEEIQINEYYYESKKDYNKDVLNVVLKKSNPFDVKGTEIEAKEKKHKAMIDTFIDLFKQNGEFNFAQVVSLGLATIYGGDAVGNSVVAEAKVLLKYNHEFTQLLRILLSSASSTSHGEDFEELNARVQVLIRNIHYLSTQINKDGSSCSVHEVITQSGQHPENLVFFAMTLAHQSSVSGEELDELVKVVSTLPKHLKGNLLNSVRDAKLPFGNATIISENSFPTLTVSDLENYEKLNDTIAFLDTFKASYAYETRFNDIDIINKAHNFQIDVSSLESKYGIQFPDNLKNKHFIDFKKAIVQSDASIEHIVFEGVNEKSSALAFDVVSLIVESSMHREHGWQTQARKIATLLFNLKKSLRDQLNDVDHNNKNIASLLNTLSSVEERTSLLDGLSERGLSGDEALGKVLGFLQDIQSTQGEVLTAKGYGVHDLLKSASQEFIHEHFNLWRVSTKFFLKFDSSVSLSSLYQFVEKIAKVDDDGRGAEKVIDFCIRNNEYSAMKILSYINHKVDNAKDIIELLVSQKVEDLKQLTENSSLDLEKLLKMSDMSKVQVVIDISTKFHTELSKVEYDKILKAIVRYDSYYAKQLKSYLLGPKLKELTKQEQLKLVLDNIDDLDKSQVLYSKYNVERFNYDKSRVISKITEIKHKNGGVHEDGELLVVEQSELYRCFVSTLERAVSYKDMNINELHDKSVELKHARMLLKEGTVAEVRDTELEFLAVSIEMMYREVGKFPRDTQILSVLNSIIHDGHLIQEIATGQGKSIITALHAAYLWFSGYTVDVVTSSRELAARDLNEFASYYTSLGIRHSKDIILSDSSVDAYQKGGVNYATASDLALFRADREFYSSKRDLSLNADVSLVCDEIDATLTSAVNYKLALPSLNTNQEETRALFGHIIDFAETGVFQNTNISRQDDVKNLEMYLHYQFQLYDSSYVYPLSAVQLNDLKLSSEARAKKLYGLHSALQKCGKTGSGIFDDLLDGVVAVKQLREGIEYVVLREELDKKEGLMVATPIINDQASRGTVFGNGVQAFLHLLIEKAHPELSFRFDIAAPTSTIFNVSPKNFFEYYKMSGGRIVGLTGTAGGRQEVEEFRVTNKLLSYSMPRFEEDQKKIVEIEVSSASKQLEMLSDILDGINGTRPVIIFCDDTRAAEQLFDTLVETKATFSVQLSASSYRDTGSVEEVVQQAGTSGYVTITTPMLGRGTDFFTSNVEGFVAINLCVDLTHSTLTQIYGRVGRNGQKGEVISLFNQAEYVSSIAEHMENLSAIQKAGRSQSQPVTDVLKYFNVYNQDHPLSAIACNVFITKVWKLLNKENQLLGMEERKSSLQLRQELVKAVKLKYPHITENLEEYLARVDSGVPERIGTKKQDVVNFVDIVKYLDVKYPVSSSSQGMNALLIEKAVVERCNVSALYNVPFFEERKPMGGVEYVIQTKSVAGTKSYSEEQLLKIWNSPYYLDRVLGSARSESLSSMAIPEYTGTIYHGYYNNFYHANMAVLYTHVFAIPSAKFGMVKECDYRLSLSTPVIDSMSSNQVWLYLNEDKKLFCQIGGTDSFEVKTDGTTFVGTILQKLKDRILSHHLTSGALKLHDIEKMAISELLLSQRLIAGDILNGEGARGNLMLNEFKSSFESYRDFVKSEEVNKIGDILEHFHSVVDIDTDKLEHGKYQAIDILTKFDTTASHAESILTDGVSLFWINRGGGSGTEPGIKIFRIVKDIKEVKDVLNVLKIAHSQVDTRKMIWNLLSTDDGVPEYVTIDMEAQIIGNCGWVQVKSMLLAVSVAIRMGTLYALPDVTSAEWQKAVKDGNDIYKDFVAYDRIKKLEFVMFSIDEKFKAQFLTNEDKLSIDERRPILNKPTSQELVEGLSRKLERTFNEYRDTIYEKQAYSIMQAMQFKSVMYSKMGTVLQWCHDYDEGKVGSLLSSYGHKNSFEVLNKIYELIVGKAPDDSAAVNSLFCQTTQHIVDSDYYIYDLDKLLKTVEGITTECLSGKIVNGPCVRDKLEMLIYPDADNGGECVASSGCELTSQEVPEQSVASN